MTDATIVCVLGMARSGTSLTTRILSLLGVHLGAPENLPGPRSYNPTGTWEHQLIHEINEGILSRLGGTWFAPPDFPRGWEQASELDDLRQRALAVVRDDFAAAEVWGWKDPRTCLTLPFWRQILPPMRYVICLRNPLDVALSLERFVHCTLEKGFHLWLLYTKSALEHTVDQHRILTSFENMIGDWHIEVHRLLRFLERPDWAHRAESSDAIRATIDETLQHHHTSVDSLAHVLHVYEELARGGTPIPGRALDSDLQDVLARLEPEAERKEAWKKRVENSRWAERLRLARQDMAALIPPGERFILADEAKWGREVVADRRAVPFPERDGQYAGPPPDDQLAIQEFERTRRSGARFMVVGWPAFWWLDYYPDFDWHLRSKFRCLLRNDRLIIFDLRSLD